EGATKVGGPGAGGGEEGGAYAAPRAAKSGEGADITPRPLTAIRSRAFSRHTSVFDIVKSDIAASGPRAGAVRPP
ncbi:MAG: hypothetical protein ACHP7N_19025, partial [Caulobacterales bacterium]